MSSRLLFTKSAIIALPSPPNGKRSTYYDEKTQKLALRVTASGSRTFYVVKRTDSGMAWLKLGSFPDMTVENARKMAEAALGQFAQGCNPAKAKQAEKAALTLGEVFGRYMREYAIPHGIKRTADIQALWERCLGDLPDLPAKKHGRKRTKHPAGVNWEKRKLEKIETSDIRSLHSAIGSTHSTMSNRVVELLSAIYNKAIEWGYKGGNPTKGVKAFSEASRDRFMQPEEFPLFIAALAADTSEAFKSFVLLLLLTGARRENVLGMRWGQVSLERAVWRIPDDASKNGEPIIVPLSGEAIEILKARQNEGAGSPFVFPAESASGYMTPPKKRWADLKARAGIADLRLHDLRRTMGSWQAITGASLAIIGKSLGHKSLDATLIYARLHIDPVRDSMEKATAAMLSAAGVKNPATVRPIVPKAKHA
jgi:integrase